MAENLVPEFKAYKQYRINRTIAKERGIKPESVLELPYNTAMQSLGFVMYQEKVAEQYRFLTKNDK